MRPMSSRFASWIVVAVALIVAETPVVYLLRRVLREISVGVAYLVGVLVVSSVWALALGVVTGVLSAAAIDFFYVPPSVDFVVSDPPGAAATRIVLAVAVICSVLRVARDNEGRASAVEG
jgi:two-component system sensor histidine kinase KdpD